MIVGKYALALEDNQIIEMPENANILTVQMQNGKPHLWATINIKERLVKRKFKIIGTGQEFDEHGLRYIGTFQLYAGDLIFHLFENLNYE